MGRLVVNNAMTVNGAFEAPSPDEWLVLDPDSNNVSLEQLLVADAMLLGRKTYEGLAAVWPTLAGDPTMGVFADRINSMPKYVASRTLREPLEWNATLLEGDLAESVPALKQRHEGTLFVSGAGEPITYRPGS
jgi:dihydrofolate reductase